MPTKIFPKFKWRYVFFAVLINFLTVQVHAQLSGKYTIDPKGSGSTNYTTFQAAVDDLNKNGVSGPVEINIANGTYNEQIVLSSVKGASSTNTITFQSANKDSSKVILTYASSTTSTNNFTLSFSGAQYFIFKQITVERSGTSTYGRALNFEKNASDNQVLRCLLKAALNTSSNSAVVYNASSSLEERNVFKNNHFKYGYYAFYGYGSSSTSLESGTVIENNIIDSFYYYGIYLYYQDGPSIVGNKISNPQNTLNYGIRVAYCDNDLMVMNNTYYSNSSSTMYGMYIYYCDGSSKALVANNMISLEGSGSAYGAYIYYSSYIRFYHNSVRVDATGSTNRALYVYGSNSSSYTGNEIINNILANMGNGEAMFQSYAINVTKSDYNAFYAPNSTTMFNYDGSSYSTLADYQKASSMDAKSINVNPSFKSSSNLHTMAATINDKGTPLSDVKYDIDMQIRSTKTPDIGADEFTPPTTDAGIPGLNSPLYTCAGKEDVYVRLKNYGLDALDSVKITYILDGKTQTSQFYKLAPLNSGKEVSVKVGTITVSSTLQKVKIYTDMPNGNTDAINTNDTLNTSIMAAMSGNYTIGTSKTADYNTFKAAIADLAQFGVCSAVNFKVESGTYAEQVSIPQIYGVSGTKKITFDGGDSSKTILEYASQTGSTDNYALELNGANYITFKNMTIQRTGSNTYAQVLYIHGGSCNNIFTHCQFMGVYQGSSSTSRALVYSNSDNDTGNLFSNNLLKRADAGIYFYGTGSTSLESGTVIEYNTLDSIYNYGIYLYYQDAPIIRYNTVTTTTYTSSYAIRAGYCDNGLQLYNNKVISGGGYGLSVYYCDATSSKMGMTYNNMVSVGGTSTAYGIYFYYSSYQILANNSVLVTSTSTSGRAIYAYGSTSITYYNEIYNNIFANTGGGYTIYASGSTYFAKSDYNVFYAPNSSTAYYFAAAYTSLSDYQKASSLEANSMETDPGFFAFEDLHTKAKALDGKAIPVSGITFDFDNEKRDSKKPDIGADEFFPPANDIALKSIISPYDGGCGDSTATIEVALLNAGSNSQTGFKVTVKVDDGKNVNTYSATYNKILYPSDMDNLTISTAFNSYYGGNYTVTAYAELPKDGDLSNDTIVEKIYINEKPEAIKGTPDSSCGSAQLTLKAKASNSNYVVAWFDSPTATMPLDTGNIFETPVLSKNTVFYVSQISLVSGCEGRRTPVKGIIHDAPKGVGVIKGSVFDGSFNSGTEKDPDILCAKNTISYELQPPTGYTALDFGTKWIVTGFDFATAYGTLPSDTFTSVNPNNGNLMLYFTPNAKFGDSTFRVALTILDIEGGCDTTVIRYIKINNLPKAKFGFENVCVGNDVVFTDSTIVTGVAKFEYDFGDNTTEKTKNPIHTYAKAGNYEVKLMVTNINGCVDTFKRIVSVYPKPQAKFEPVSGCVGQAVQFDNTSKIEDTSALTYTWYIGDTAVSNSANPALIFKEAKTYKVGLKVSSIYGCTDSFSSTVRVYSFPSSDYKVKDVCEGESTSFSASAMSGSYKYEWNFGDNTSGTGANVSHTYSSPGTYNATLYVTNANGCTDSTTKVVNVNSLPKASFTTKDVCLGNTAMFSNDVSSNPANSTYQWSFGDNITSNDESPTHIYNSAGTYTVRLIATSPTGCSDTMTMEIKVNVLPTAAFDAPNKCVGEMTQFTNNSSISSGNIAANFWSFGDGDTSSLSNPQHTYTNSGSYNVILVVMSDNGCVDSISKMVNVYAKPSLTFTKSVTERTVVFTASDNSYNRYIWDFGDGSKDSGIVVTHTYTSDDTYNMSLHVYTITGCDAVFTDTVTIKSVGIQEAKAELLGMKIYPNPYKESIHLQYTLLTTSQVNIAIFDLNGKQITQVFNGIQSAGSQSFNINASENNLQAGIYLMRIIINDQVYYKQVIGL